MQFGGRTSCQVRVRSRLCAGLAAAIGVCLASPAVAIEAFDGRVQLHGFFEIQNRILARDFDLGDDAHLAQWWNVVNLELEWETLPEGWGPFDMVSMYTRVEARYDLVWHSQDFLPSYKNRYGDHAKRLPKRLSNGNRNSLRGQVDPSQGLPDNYADARNHIKVPLDQRVAVYGAPAGLGLLAPNERHLGHLWNVPALSVVLFAAPGPDGIWGIDQRNGQFDDSGFYVAEKFLDYRFGLKRLPGNVGDNGAQVLGPYRPEDEVPGPGVMRDRANPLRGPCTDDYFADPDRMLAPGESSPGSCDLRPALKDRIPYPEVSIIDPSIGPDDPPNVPGTPAIGGQGELPFRPAPQNPYYTRDSSINSSSSKAPLDEAQGLYIPNAGFVRLLKQDHLEFAPDENFEQWQLGLNWGQSQLPWRELKELYFDIEMFDHRLWLRVGRQTIVWGKTELFRAQDQFNPQDLGLASLPTLEESRVPLWSARGVWSFYDVGPLDDVRLEAALNWDKFYPVDTGRCGEPFAPRPACTRSFGIFGNALIGSGIAGEYRYPYPWEDPQSLEGGVRLEFRHRRASYALTYWNGFEDSPYTDPVFVFSRNVDAETGWPRLPPLLLDDPAQPCRPEPVDGKPADSSGCLGKFSLDAMGNPVYDADNLAHVLANHHGNQQLFQVICASTVGFAQSLLPEGCGFNVWNSVESALPELGSLAPRLGMAFSAILGGTGNAEKPLFNGETLLQALGRYDPLAVKPLVPLFNGGSYDYDGTVDGPSNDMPTPATSADDAWYCGRLGQRFATSDPCASVAAASGYQIWRGGGSARFLTDEQEALLGCGRFWGSDCDVDGFDIFNSEASAFLQSWPGFEGTGPGLLFSDASTPQPGTLGFVPLSGPICTRMLDGREVMLPGCRGPEDPGYDVTVDGSPGCGASFGLPDCPVGVTPFEMVHPFTGQRWRSEMAAVSWNLLMAFVTISAVTENNDSGFLPGAAFDDAGNLLTPGRVCVGRYAGGTASCNSPSGDPNGLNDQFEAQGLLESGRFDEFDPTRPFARDRCSFYLPLLCKNVNAILQLSAQTRAVRASRFGRRDFSWHGGAQVALDYQRRSVLGLAMDFAEDRTGSNWNVEFTWFHRQRFANQDALDLTTESDTWNLVVSVDRPTFIRFLNKNRTFFVNGQVFLQWIPKHTSGFTANGKLNALFTVGIFTGYYQDRLIPSLQFVYDAGSQSGALLYGAAYRVTEHLTMQVGLNAFWGTVQSRPCPMVPVGTAGGCGAGAGQQHSFVENGLSPVRDRDELFVRIRYSF